MSALKSMYSLSQLRYRLTRWHAPASSSCAHACQFCAVQDGELQPNEFTWTSYANIIFLESPAFVGWSYSNNTQDLAVGES